MENVFTDPAAPPTPSRIAEQLGAAHLIWLGVLKLTETQLGEVTWRFYRDGGWLAKAMRKSKTLAWMAIGDGKLRISFYFAERLRETLLDEPIDQRLRELITGSQTSGKLLAVSLPLESAEDLKAVEQLLAMKVRLK